MGGGGGFTCNDRMDGEGWTDGPGEGGVPSGSGQMEEARTLNEGNHGGRGRQIHFPTGCRGQEVPSLTMSTEQGLGLRGFRSRPELDPGSFRDSDRRGRMNSRTGSGGLKMKSESVHALLCFLDLDSLIHLSR